MKAALAILALSASASAAMNISDVRTLYMQWSRMYGRLGASLEERETRFANFQANVAEMQRLNTLGSATFAPNAFADYSRDELRARLGFRVPSPQMVSMMGPRVSTKPAADAPANVDWRQTKVAAIQDQGSCGSCWAFSAASNTESRIAIVYNRAVEKLSEQQLVDCDHVCGSYRSVSGCDAGCNGGLMPNAWTYQRDHDLMTSDVYPYTPRAGTCKDQSTKPNGVITGFELYSEDEVELTATLAQKGPVAIAVDASAWSFYRGGIMTNLCSHSTLEDLNHAVNIVGYGTEGGQDYWIVRNSWGASWVRGV